MSWYDEMELCSLTGSLVRLHNSNAVVLLELRLTWLHRQRIQFLLVMTTSVISAFTRHWVSGHTRTFVCRVAHLLLQCSTGGCTESDDQQTATSVERRSLCGQRYPPRLVTTPPYRATLAGCYWASRVQTRHHGVQLPSRSSASVPRGIVPTSHKCRITATSLISHPTAPSRTAPPAQLLWPTGFLCIWSVSLEFPAGQLAESDYWREQFQTIPEYVFCLQHTDAFSTLEVLWRCAI